MRLLLRATGRESPLVLPAAGKPIMELLSPSTCLRRKGIFSLLMMVSVAYLLKMHIARRLLFLSPEARPIDCASLEDDAQPCTIQLSSHTRKPDSEGVAHAHQTDARAPGAGGLRQAPGPGYRTYSTATASRPQPVVLEKYRLILFANSKVGKTAWRMLCRKLMGFKDYTKPYGGMLPRSRTGLRYLDQYSEREIETMMHDPLWTHALFVRDPKERLLSAYLDKVFNQPRYFTKRCCNQNKTCTNAANESMETFFDIMTNNCPSDDHWTAQSHAVEPRHWRYMNFIGHMENVFEDAKRLLVRIGAWEEHGQTGWGTHRNESVFAPLPDAAGRQHSTNAKAKLKSYYNPHLERMVEGYYEIDYLNPALNLTRTRIFD